MMRVFRQRLARIRCCLRGYHVVSPDHVAKFRYDVDGFCFDCGKVGSGYHEPGE